MTSTAPVPGRGLPGAGFLAGCALALLSLPVLFYRLGDAEISGVLEARVAITAREMGEKGEWVLPTMNGLPRLQKPPLAYWLAMASAAVRGGHDELSVRLPMAALGLATVFIAWRIGARMAGRAVGWLAALLLLTTMLFAREHRLASADAPLSFCAAAAWLCGLEARLAPAGSAARRAARGLFYTCLALGVLAKGPVILALVVLPLAVEAVALGRLEPLRALWSPWGLVGFLVLGLAWPALVVERVGLDVAQQWFLESFGKMAPSDGIEDGYHYQRHTEAMPYYFLRLPTYFVFWIWAFLLGLWPGARALLAARRDTEDRSPCLRAWAFVTFLTVFIFFSLVEEKKGPYLLPAMLPGALLAALGMVATSPQVKVAAAWIAGGFTAALAGCAVTLLVAPGLLLPGRLAAVAGGFFDRPGPLAALAALLAAGCWQGGRCLRSRDRAAQGFAWLAACVAASFPAYFDLRLALPAHETSMKTAAAAAAPFLPPSRRVAVAGQLPLDFLYYLHADVRFVHHTVGGELALDGRQLPGVGPSEPFLISEALLVPWLEPPGPAPGSPQGIDTSRRLAGDLAAFRIEAALGAAGTRARDRFYLLRRG